jgi:hypothetical protein
MPAKTKAKKRIKRSEAFVGIHFDFHAGHDCMAIGKTLTRKMLRDMLALVKPDFVQCDCKGHPGLASYPTEAGTPASGFVRDPLKLWREVTAELGVSLYVHYSGVIDGAAVAEHPDWAARQPDGKQWKNVTSVFGPYVDKRMIPMFKELVDRYRIDGIWVDGECWGLEMDYSRHARKAWKKATGLDHMPVAREDKHFERFRRFQREGFRKYLRHYVDEMHAYAPGLEIASNWAFTAHMPEPVSANVDYLSGDITPQHALTEALMDSRLLAQQGKPWDLMAWSFSGKWGEPGQTTKTALQLQQEAGVVIAAGGGFQAYFQQKRDASIRPWMMSVMAETAAFCRARQPYCHHAQPVPQIGLILSREAYYRHIDKLMRPWGRVYQAYRGILCCLLDSQNVVDVVMDHNIENDIERYPLLVVPEWKAIGTTLKRRLREYVEKGGKLLLIGAEPTRLFARDLKVTLRGKPFEQARYIAEDGRMGGVFSVMQEVEPKRGAEVHRWLYRDNEEEGQRIPAALVTRRGRGEMAAVPFDMGQRYGTGRTTVMRDFLDGLVRRLMPAPIVNVTGSQSVAVSLMCKNGNLMVHINNLAGGRESDCTTFDEIPATGPLELRLRLKRSPSSITLRPGGQRLKWRREGGQVVVKMPGVKIHDIVEVT